MTLTVDFFFSFRSPYSYLAVQQAEQLVTQYDLRFEMRIVRPLALRVPGFFKRIDPLGPPYVLRDAARVARRLGIPYRFPEPDPVVMDMTTGEVAIEQPLIWPISRLGVAAQNAGCGLGFAASASRRIWSGEIPDWSERASIAGAAEEAGLELATLEAEIARDTDVFDATIAANEAAQQQAGHWGVPLFLFEGEPFFGQDRLTDLIWHLGNNGLASRPSSDGTAGIR